MEKSIADEKVLEAINKDLIITGGCFTSFLNNESPNDFDCYMRTKESALVLANYYVGVWSSEHDDKSCVLTFQ